MVLRPSVHNQLTMHRLAAKESRDCMRTAIAEIHEIIKQTRGVIQDTRKAIIRTDALLGVTPEIVDVNDDRQDGGLRISLRKGG